MLYFGRHQPNFARMPALPGTSIGITRTRILQANKLQSGFGGEVWMTRHTHMTKALCTTSRRTLVHAPMPPSPLKSDSSEAEYLSAFRAFIAQYVVLTEREWQRTNESLETLHIPANTSLLREGEVCRHLYFLNKGIVRFFVMNDDGKDTTKFFTTEHELFTSQQSFSSQVLAREYIESLEETHLFTITYDALQRLYEEVPKWHIFIRRVLQAVNGMTEGIYMDSITLTAEERYRRLLQDEPEIALRAPLKHIASYLGVTPESLSRIRKKLSQA